MVTPGTTFDRAAMPTTKKRLTDDLVSDLQPKADRYELQDTKQPAFRVRVAPSGVKTLCVLYRVKGSRRLNRYTLGPAGQRTVTEYRADAAAIVTDARKGIDAAASLRSRKAAPTVKSLFVDSLADCAVRLKPKTVIGYRSGWTAHLEKPIGPLQVTDVTTADVVALHRKLKDTPYAANRALNLLQSFFAYAITHGHRDKLTNPADDVKPYTERARERFLSVEELTRLLIALDTAETVGLPPAPRKSRRKAPTVAPAVSSPDAPATPRPPRHAATAHTVGALRFLLLTGWREQEALTLRWDAVDDVRGLVTLQDTKTGKSQRPLGAAAMALLAAIPRVHGSAFCFPSPRKPSRPVANIEHLWRAVRHAADLATLRLHDVRHSAASFALGAGVALPVIGKMLGHKHTATTARYAHLTNDPVRVAGDAVAAVIDAARATRSTPVTPITQKRRKKA